MKWLTQRDVHGWKWRGRVRQMNCRNAGRARRLAPIMCRGERALDRYFRCGDR